MLLILSHLIICIFFFVNYYIMSKEYKFLYKLNDNFNININVDNIKLMIKIIIYYTMTFFGVFLVFINYCKFSYFVLLELGLILNLFFKSRKNITLFLNIIFSLLYFRICKKYNIYATSLIYLIFNIMFCIIATIKKDNRFIQYNKRVTYYNYMLIVNIGTNSLLFLSIIDYILAGKFIILDCFCAIFLLFSIVLKEERYFDYYIFKIITSFLMICLWISAYIEFTSNSIVMFIMLYTSILIYNICVFLLLIMENYKLNQKSNKNLYYNKE